MPSSPTRLASDAAGWAVSGVLAVVAAVRRGKAVHPHGAVHRATLRVPGDPAAPSAARLLSEPGEHAAIVRFSRSVGLPRPLPDLLGMSIRVLDAYGDGRHQDLLLVTSVDLPLIHHVFVPAGDVQARIYSSSLPFSAGEERFLIGALPRSNSPRPQGGNELDRLARAAATGELRFDLAVAPLEGRFRPVAELQVGERLGPELDALRFNPFNCGGGMAPSGMFNRWRAGAYPLSQGAWRRTKHDGAERQDTADARLRALHGGVNAAPSASDRQEAKTIAR
jgi:hypothetical protein